MFSKTESPSTPSKSFEKVKLESKWITLTYQRGAIDTTEAPHIFGSEIEARNYAMEWAAEIAFTDETQHEIVVFKAIYSFRGRTKIIPTKFEV